MLEECSVGEAKVEEKLNINGGGSGGRLEEE